MDDKSAVEPLIGSLKGNDSVVRSKVAFDLGNLGDIYAEDPMILALKDEDEIVRDKAALALGIIGNN